MTGDRSPDGAKRNPGWSIREERTRITLRSIRATGPDPAGLIRPDHLEHVFRLDLEIIAAAAGADDRAGGGGLVDAVLDHGLVDMDGDDLAQRQPGVGLLAVGALEADDVGYLALEGDRALADARHVDELAGHGGQPRDLELVDL